MRRRAALLGVSILALLGLAWLLAGREAGGEARVARKEHGFPRAKVRRAPVLPSPAEPGEDTDEVLAGPRIFRAEAPEDTDGDALVGVWTVHGVVEDSDGEPIARAAVRCTVGEDEFSIRTDRRGRFEVRLRGEGECRAFRRDGVLLARSDAVSVTGEPGEFDVDLELPSERTGGIGIAFEATDEGMVLTEVYPDTPAGRAGLEPGDVILEVDGLPAAALDSQEFIETMTGPEGSGVTFTVAYATDTGFATEQHRVVRSYLERTEGGGVRGVPVDTGG